MSTVVIVYATREGMTQSIAEYLAKELRQLGHTVDLFDAHKLRADFSLASYSAAVIAGSVHLAKHERELARFVKWHHGILNQMPTTFVSVSLSQAGAEDERATPEQRSHAASDVKMMIEQFLAKAEWRPTLIRPVAGALMYRKYNPLKRMLMRAIARKAGATVDTSKNHVFTKWNDLDRLTAELANQITTLPGSPRKAETAAV